MKRNKKTEGIIFSFLLVGFLLKPIAAYAADSGITKEQTFTTSADSEKEFAGHVDFAEAIIENGKTYELSGIDYKVLSKEYLDKKEKSVDSKVIEVGKAYEPEGTITEDGITYKLKGVIQETQPEEDAYEQEVVAYEEYQREVGRSDLPVTKVVQAANAKTGQMQDVVCTLTGISRLGTNTETSYMTVTYVDYNAAYYEWNGNLISRNDAPALAGYEDQLLSAVGAEAGSTITDISWAGDTYQDGDGVLCRDAVATVQRAVPIYRADYVGRIYQEAKEGNIYHMTYEGTDPEGKIQYEVKATASYKQKATSPLPYVLTGVGIAIVIAAIVAILMILKKKTEENES